MRRTALVAAGPLALVAAMWLRLEQPRETGLAAALAAIALATALVRPARVRAVAAFVAALAAAWIVFGTSSFVHPGRTASRFWNGFLDFYDVSVPLDPRRYPRMADVILVAVFALALALALAIAARATVVAVVALLVGAGWPATLLAGGSELGRGALILCAALLLLLGTAGRIGGRAAVAASTALVLGAVALSTSSAVSRHELVGWQRWDPYDKPDPLVGVRYVWDAQYAGIHFPARRTVVLRIEAPPSSSYWRAGTLDEFAAGRWREAYVAAGRLRAGLDPLLPARARTRNGTVEERVTVEALRDDHLVGGSIPVAFDAGSAALVHPAYGVALFPGGAPRGLTYSVRAYAPQPAPAAVERSLPRYPPSLDRYLELAPGVEAPGFGATRRRVVVRRLAAGPYAPLAARAEAVAGSARTPYEAAARLESWFRARGGFRYDEHPRQRAGVPPLVDFVTRTRAGYCQHFAGAMALMLRTLGVPSRVAFGFTSGSYDARKRVWTVTDHDAHAWVEAWFRGYGWLPFDPTPGRGTLSAPYSTGSPGFLEAAPGALARALGLLGGPSRLAEREPKPNVGGTASARGGSSFPWAAVVLPGAVVATLLLLALAKLVRRRSRYLTADPRRLASACRRELAEFLADQRLETGPAATLSQLGRLLADELALDASRFVEAAEAARFGPPAAAAEAAGRARDELRTLERTLRHTLGPRARARGLVSPRSLGLAG